MNKSFYSFPQDKQMEPTQQILSIRTCSDSKLQDGRECCTGNVLDNGLGRGLRFGSPILACTGLFHLVIVQIEAQNIVLLSQFGIRQHSLCSFECSKGIHIATGLVGVMLVAKNSGRNIQKYNVRNVSVCQQNQLRRSTSDENTAKIPALAA